MKNLIIINNLSDIKKASLFDGFILPIEQLSKGFDSFFTISQLNEALQIIHEYGKESYIFLNDLYKDTDFILINELLVNLNINLVSGIMASDIGVIQFLKDQKLHKKGIYNPSSLLASVSEFNQLKKDKIKGGVIANNISLNEILEIAKKSKVESFLFGYARSELFTTITKLVTNFDQKYNTDFSKKKDLSLVEKLRPNEYLPITECARGSVIFSANLVNFTSQVTLLKDNKLDYFIFDSRHNNLEEIIRIQKALKHA